jgi:hypothetical protein
MFLIRDIGYTRLKDPLAGWSDNKNYEHFPTVARMARDYLCIPAASVGVEREFYHARCQSEFNRTYKGATFEAIMMVKNHLKYEQKVEYDAYIQHQYELGDTVLAEADELKAEDDTRKNHNAAILAEQKQNGSFISDNEEESCDEDMDDDELHGQSPISSPIADRARKRGLSVRVDQHVAKRSRKDQMVVSSDSNSDKEEEEEEVDTTSNRAAETN